MAHKRPYDELMKGKKMANYGRGHGNETPEEQEKYDDEIAMREGDYDWLEKSPRQNRLRQEQGLSDHEYAREVDE